MTPDRLKLGPTLAASHGELKSFALLRSEAQGKAMRYQYRALFGKSPHLVMFIVTEDKKIAGANIQPE